MNADVEERNGVTRGAIKSAAVAQGQARTSFPLKLTRDLRLLLIALWLGGAVFFSFAVAPTVFDVLPTRELAGAVVTRTLSIVNTSGVIISVLLLISAFLFKSIVSRRAFYVELISLLLVALTTSVGQWVITPRLVALRAQMGRPIDEVSASDPLRTAFNSLHSYSVTLLTIGMIAAVIALLLIARRTGK